MHRRARGKLSICRKYCSLNEMTLDDERVTCPDCLEILAQLKFTQSHTSMINRLAIKDGLAAGYRTDKGDSENPVP